MSSKTEQALIDARNHEALDRARALQRVRDKHAPIIAKLEQKLAKEGCTHPTNAHESFTWEHDNGYGVQKWLPGVKCTLCGKLNHWPGHSTLWTDPKDISYD